MMSYFLHANGKDNQLFALKALGSMCIRHYDFMLSKDLMDKFLEVLTNDSVDYTLKTQVSENKILQNKARP